MGMLRHCQKALAGKGVNLDIVSTEMMSNLPLMNSDLEEQPSKMTNVYEFHKEISGADAYLFATCEYNASISPSLKNVIDWGSRGKDGNIWDNKPAAMIGAGGYAGTTRSQTALRDIFFEVNLKNLNGGFGSGSQARIQISHPGEEPPFDATTGDLTSPLWKNELDRMMGKLVEWTNRIKEN